MKDRNVVLEQYERTFPAGTLLFREGDEGREMYVLRSGRVEISKRVRNIEKSLAVFQAGDFFGEMAILNDQPRTATARVVEDARLLIIDAATCEDMLIHNAEIALRMIRKMSDRLADADRQIETLLFRDSGARIVHALGIMAERQGTPSGEGRRVLEVSERELAMITGLDANTTATALERLGRAGLLSRKEGGIEVASRVKLEEYLDFLEMKRRVEKV